MDLDPWNLPPVLRASDAARAGLTHVVRGRSFERAGRGVYVPAGTDTSDPDVRIAVAAARIPESVTLGGWAAARQHERARAVGPTSGTRIVVFDGVRADGRPDELEPVLLCAPRTTRIVAGPGCRLLRSEVDDDERVRLGRLAVTSELRTAFDLARLSSTADAVVALDRMRTLGLLDPGALADLVRRRPRWHGVDAARRALVLSEDGVESPQESIMRLLWIAAGLPRPLCNPVVLDARGRFVARVDLLDERTGIVGEYDGAYHSAAVQRSADAERQERLESVGLITVRATSTDLGATVSRRAWQQRLRDAHGRAAGRGAVAHRWVVDEDRSRRRAS